MTTTGTSRLALPSHGPIAPERPAPDGLGGMQVVMASLSYAEEGRGGASAFSAFDERLQTEQVLNVAESDQHDTDDARKIILDVRQRVLAAFQIGNFEVRLVTPGWLVKSTSGKMARGANRRKWLAERGPA
jgi:hypothetical protein